MHTPFKPFHMYAAAYGLPARGGLGIGLDTNLSAGAENTIPPHFRH